MCSFASPPVAEFKIRRGYDRYKALEKYGNKEVDLDRYLPWKAATVQVTILRGLGEMPASSFPEPLLCGGWLAVWPLQRARYPPENSNPDRSTVRKNIGNADPVKTAA